MTDDGAPAESGDGTDRRPPVETVQLNGPYPTPHVAVSCLATDGKEPCASARLRADPTSAADSMQAAERIYDDLLGRQAAGEQPDWDHWFTQFPQYAEQLRAIRLADLLLENTIVQQMPKGAQIGEYELGDPIGRGGMGVVYKAYQKALDRTVAVKLLRNGGLADSTELDRLKVEMAAASRLNHPNIVHVYGVGTARDQPYLVFEFVDGPSLAARIAGKPLSARMAAEIVAAVADAIQFANDRGIIHRDLKPANILLSGPEEQFIPKVTDFGASKEIKGSTAQHVSQVIGTPAYMAPEQLTGKMRRVTNRTDVYGLGTILYECITGVPPFRGEDVAEIFRQVILEPPVAPRVINPAVPRDLETICLKCLAKDPGERYESANSFALDLRRYLNREPIHATRPNALVQSWMWCRRKPALAGLAAGLALSLVVGISAVLVAWRDAVVARRGAEASDAASQQLLLDLIASNSAGSAVFLPNQSPRIDSLLVAEAHCRNLLERKPSDIGLRIALTQIAGQVGELYSRDGSSGAASQHRSYARGLWEPFACAPDASAEAHDWLAKTCVWCRFSESAGNATHSLLRASSLWQRLAEEDPEDLRYTPNLENCRHELTQILSVRASAAEVRVALRNELDRLEASSAGSATDTVSRKMSALIHFLLGEADQREDRLDQAARCWQTTFDECRKLRADTPNDVSTNALTAIVASRLMRHAASELYYRAGTDAASANIVRLSQAWSQGLGKDWIPTLVLEARCQMILCHSQVGKAAAAEQLARDCERDVVQRIDALSTDSTQQYALLRYLSRSAGSLRDAQAPTVALSIARRAATFASRLAAHPSRETTCLDTIAMDCLINAATLNQLGDNPRAMEQVELARQIYSDLLQPDPNNSRHLLHLGNVWERIGKIRWKLDQRKGAIAAIEQSAAFERRAFDRDFSNVSSKAALNKTYDRIVSWAGQVGDWTSAARALAERAKLWQNDRQRLLDVSASYRDLAAQMSRLKSPLSATDESLRKSFLAESERIRSRPQHIPAGSSVTAN